MRIRKQMEWTPSHAPQSLRICAAVLLTFVFASALALAQTPGSDAPSAAPGTSSPPNAAAPPQSQSAVDALSTWVQQSGRWMQRGVTNMGAGFNQMVGAIGGQANRATRDAADAARNAAKSVSKLPNAGITGGHERCVIAPNGAPDCRVAAQALCRAKGYASGTSVDFLTVENCPPPWRTSRRDAPEGVCTMEHYVTRALCQ
jgi:hypothetical protein